MIRPACEADLPRLREVARNAKLHWGHAPNLVDRWIAQSDFSATLLRTKRVDVAVDGARVVGWSSLEPRGDVWWLDDLWIEQASMRRGFGAALFRHAAAAASDGRATRMEWESDPGAVGFYERMGAVHVRTGPGDPLFGRTLPVMGLALG